MKTYQDDPKIQKSRWLIFVSVALFTFMSTLDGSIVNIALPTISKGLSVPMNQVEWVVSIYLIVVCSCLLLFGKIGDSWGKIKVFRIGAIIFTIGSLLCGFNHSLVVLLLARVVQAVGASMTMSTNNGIITEIFPFRERGRALGTIGAFVSLGAIAGPGIGGIILAHFSWSYIFWINVPVGIITILAGEKFLPKDITMSGKSIDYPGFVTFAITILSFFGAIFIGQEIGFVKLFPIALLIVAVLAFTVFLKVEKRQEHPLITFEIFKNKIFTMSLLTALLIFASNFFINVVIPFYLQDSLKLSSGYAGILMMVFPLLMIIGSPLSGYLTDKMGPKRLIFVGLTLLSIAQIMYMFLDIKTPIPYYVLATAIMGFGNSLFQAPNNTMVMSSVTKSDLGVAGSMNAFARNFGMVVGIAASTTILYGGMSAAYGKHVTTYLPSRPDIFITGMRVTFFVSFIICLAALIVTIIRFHTKNTDTAE